MVFIVRRLESGRSLWVEQELSLGRSLEVKSMRLTKKSIRL